MNRPGFRAAADDATDSSTMAANNVYGRVGLWTGVLDAHPTSKTQNAAKEVEQLGFTTMWIPEAVGRDPFVSAANLSFQVPEKNRRRGIKPPGPLPSGATTVFPCAD